MLTCQDIMTPLPVCCLPNDWVDLAAQVMRKEDVGAIPIVTDLETKKLVGIITDRDITVKVVAEEREFKRTLIEEVMTRDPFICQPHNTLQTVLDVMTEHQVRRIPVVDEKGCVIGIVSLADIATRTRGPEPVAQVTEGISQPALSGHFLRGW